MLTSCVKLVSPLGVLHDTGAGIDTSLASLFQSPHSTSALWSSSSHRPTRTGSGDESANEVFATAAAPDASLVLLPRVAATAVHGPLHQWWCQPLTAATGSQPTRGGSSSDSAINNDGSDSARVRHQHQRRQRRRHLLAETTINGAGSALRNTSASMALAVLAGSSDVASLGGASGVMVGDVNALSGSSERAVAMRLIKASSSTTLRTALSMSALALRRARSVSGCSTLGPPSKMTPTVGNGDEKMRSGGGSSIRSRSSTLQAISAHGINSGSGDTRDRVAAARLHAYLDGKTTGNRLRVRRHSPRSQQPQGPQQGSQPSLSLTTMRTDSAPAPGFAPSTLAPDPTTTASLSSRSVDAVFRARERRSRSSHLAEAGTESSSISSGTSSGSSTASSDSGGDSGSIGTRTHTNSGSNSAVAASAPETMALKFPVAPPAEPTPLKTPPSLLTPFVVEAPSQLVPPSHGELVRAWEASHKTSPPSHGDLVRDWVQQQEETAKAVAMPHSSTSAAESATSATKGAGRSNRDTSGGLFQASSKKSKKRKKNNKKEPGVILEVGDKEGGSGEAEPAPKAPPFSVLRATATLVVLVVLAAGLARCLGLIGDDMTRGLGGSYRRRPGLFPGPVYTPSLNSRFRPVLDALASTPWRSHTTSSAPDQFLPDFLPDLWTASPSQSPRNRHRTSSSTTQTSSSSFVVQGFGPTGGGVGRPVGKPPAP